LDSQQLKLGNCWRFGNWAIVLRNKKGNIGHRGAGIQGWCGRRWWC